MHTACYALIHCFNLYLSACMYRQSQFGYSLATVLVALGRISTNNSHIRHPTRLHAICEGFISSVFSSGSRESHLWDYIVRFGGTHVLSDKSVSNLNCIISECPTREVSSTLEARWERRTRLGRMFALVTSEKSIVYAAVVPSLGQCSSTVYIRLPGHSF